MTTDVERITGDNKYRVISVEKTDPPEGMTDEMEHEPAEAPKEPEAPKEAKESSGRRRPTLPEACPDLPLSSLALDS